MADETTAGALTSGQISFTGLGSGTDFNSIVEKTVEIEGFHKKRLEAWRAEWAAKVTAFQQLNSSMLSLRTTLSGMDTMNEFLIKTTSSSDSEVLSATADSSAQVSPHSVEVGQLAQNDMFVGSHSFAAMDTVINNSGADAQFDYTYGGTSISLTVPDGTTLEGLISIINSDPDNPGVRAGYMKVSDSDYRLQIWGMDLGADNQFSIDGTTTLSNASAADMTETQNAQNAQFKVDGFPSNAGSWMERSTNTVTDAITGLTLNLKGTGTSNLSTNVDNDAIKESVRTFVSQVNSVRSLITELTKFNTTTNEGSLLTGNYGIQIISSKLKDITAAKGVGFDYDADTYVTMGQLGIRTDASEGSATMGQLMLDEDELADALADDPESVAQLFSADMLGTSDSTNLSFRSVVDGLTQPGEYDVSYTMDGAGNLVSATINGNTALIDNSTKEITGGAGFPESGLAVKVLTTTAGVHTGTVRVKQGKASQLYDSLTQLTSETDGPLKILEDNYQDIMDDIDDKIDYEEKRLVRMERELRNKYARLEALLGSYDQQSTSLANQINQLE